ncbi:MAG: HD domain-containing protein [Desulfosarcina sp.]|nr:HD domain-containing protein [Desulfobacterales bacterium]
MDRKKLDHFKLWFNDYVSGYLTENSDNNYIMLLKQEHTLRVCRNIVMLGTALHLSEQDLILAETMALFHDIGRFKQYALYGTFNDLQSVNHARLGLNQLGVNRVLSVCSTDTKRLIAKSIAYHNAAVIPKYENKNTLFFIRLLRDADKLDIWKVVTDYYSNKNKKTNTTIELGLPDDPVCSKKVIIPLHDHRIVKIEDIKTLNDFKLLQISWVFDLNFAPSFKAVQKHNYLELIKATLPESKEIHEAVQEAQDYVHRMAYLK